MVDAAVTATPIGVLTSCATPATSAPSATIFSCSTSVACAASSASVRRCLGFELLLAVLVLQLGAPRAAKDRQQRQRQQALVLGNRLGVDGRQDAQRLPSVSTIGMPM
jgi:hypothetical protein